MTEATRPGVENFRIDVPDEVLEDLQTRLAMTRWPDEVDGAGWDYGTNMGYLKGLCEYWQIGFDWREQETKLNEFSHFKADIGGLGIHFIHEKGKGENPTPLLLTHGWPDSFYRFHKVIPLLTDPERFGGNAEDSFDVVVPSVPGYGFSERPKERGMNEHRTADIFAKLMTDVLGYEKFVAHGGDVGSIVTMALARDSADAVAAVHLTDVGYPTGQEDFSTMTEAELEFAGFIQQWWISEGAYAMLQSTKPQSVAYSLNDSPSGLAAWILSFLDTGADEHRVEEAFGGRDELLTNITIYWVTQTAGSAARMYLEGARASYGEGSQSAQRSEVPAAVALFPREAQPPREWAERSLNVQRWTEMPRGGHFAALEEPELLAEDLRTFFRYYR